MGRKRPLRLSPRLLRRVLATLAALLALGGAGFMAYPFATDLWAARIQRGLTEQFNGEEMAARYSVGRIYDGDALTRLEIPKLGVNVIVVEGTGEDALRAGAGHYPQTPLPGEVGNVAIAGHRTTYGRPFNRIDELAPGDRIVLTTPLGREVYEVSRPPSVVDDEDWSVIFDVPRDRALLTLTSCHPEGSAAQRIVVRAELAGSSGSLASQGGVR